MVRNLLLPKSSVSYVYWCEFVPCESIYHSIFEKEHWSQNGKKVAYPFFLVGGGGERCTLETWKFF